MKRNNIKRIFISFPFIVGVFIIIYAGIGIVYYQKQGQYQDLQSQIARNRAILQKPGYDLKALENKLSNIETQLRGKTASLPTSEQGIEIIDTLIDVAQTSNVEVMSVQGAPLIQKQANVASTSKGQAKVTDISTSPALPILPVIFTVKGTQEDILAFISSITGSPELLKSSEVNGVNIRYNISSDGEYITEIELNIYVQAKASP